MLKYSTWWFIPRIVSGLVHPSDFSGFTLPHVNHWDYKPLTIRGMSRFLWKSQILRVGPLLVPISNVAEEDLYTPSDGVGLSCIKTLIEVLQFHLL